MFNLPKYQAGVIQIPIAALLTSIFVWALGSAIARMLTGAGIAILTYQGISSYVGDILALMSSELSGLSSDIVNIAAMAGFGEALNIIGSAALGVASLYVAGRIVGLIKT